MKTAYNTDNEDLKCSRHDDTCTCPQGQALCTNGL